jgi:hypothetical protein
MTRILVAILITLAVAMFVANAHAGNSVEIIGPSITWHVVDGGGASQFYNHPISPDGRVLYTPMLGLKQTNLDSSGVYNSLALFTAQNSIGKPIYGGIMGTGLNIWKGINAGFVFGGYVQNNTDFQNLGITPFSMTSGVNAFVPLMGLEVNFHIKLTDKTFFSINNTITPIITNHNLSFGVNY